MYIIYGVNPDLVKTLLVGHFWSDQIYKNKEEENDISENESEENDIKSAGHHDDVDKKNEVFFWVFYIAENLNLR